MDHQHQEEEWSSCTSTRTGGGVPVPPGFRFHPTEEELVGYYLARKVLLASSSHNSPRHNKQQMDDLLDGIIQEVDLYRIEPWDLQERCSSSKHTIEQTTAEWYFFSYKDRKYPSGTRTNRATAAGFWKATGRDKPVLSRQSTTRSAIIGMRKTLVFYRGRAPNGRKTEWIMHEYRLQCDERAPAQEEGWVVCRAFRKPIPNMHHHQTQSRPPPHSYYAYAAPTPPPHGHGYYGYDHHHSLHHPAAGINIMGGAGFPIPPQSSSLYSSSADDDRLCFSSILPLPQLESPTTACCAADDDGSSVAQTTEAIPIRYPATEQHDDDEQQLGQLPGGAGATAIDWSFLDSLLAITTSHQLHHDDYPL
ncbi:hypothetical protein BS78_06G294800 [Paspalum vaginatum]|nr:hypothetical protein BS78_06G294800 [Paspalum vaginatum]KAJ1273605.1 hypothetical protein BS78_06G294800 [Paspalum vaginatum]KAJ1273606.1 hypothetical protein BS78_06G294800 [Paspalum vaginatum]KAJ1273607.1 hypothetical protein BS78_06G294800 [Paspalum vaginatum]